MSTQLSVLWDELDLGGGCPLPDAAAVKRRVNAALNADPSERKLYMRQKIRFAAILIAAVTALAGTALAVGSNWDAVVKALGAYAPYAQEVTGVSVTDQGLKVTVEAVLADEGRAVAYVSVADLTGDRLDENTAYNGAYYGKCVSYDPETHTALFAITVRERNYEEDDTITLNFKSFQPGMQQLYGLGFPQELLADRTLETRTLPAGEFERGGRQDDAPAVVLLPDQTPAPLEGTDLVWVSSAGFDADGVFHILYEAAEGVNCYLWPYFQTVEFDDREGPSSFTTAEIRFGGGRYIDVSYPADHDEYNDWPPLVTRENVSHLTLTDAQSILYTRPEIAGEWLVSFSPGALPQRTLAVEDTLSGMRLTAWTLSPMTVRLAVDSSGGTPADYPLSLYLADGTTVPVSGRGLIEMREPSAISTDGRHRYDFVITWTLDAPIDPEQVTGVSLGYRMYPVAGDSAGPGYWLDQLPVE